MYTINLGGKNTSCKLFIHHSQVFFKIGVLTNCEMFTGKHLCWSLLLMNLQATLLKETPTQVFSHEYCENSKNSFFLRNNSCCFCTLGSAENIVSRNGKKHYDVTFSYNYVGSSTQADHVSWRLQYSHVFFILLSCFSCGKFEKTLVTCNI